MSKGTVFAAALWLLTSAVTAAGDDEHWRGDHRDTGYREERHLHAAPELDPGQALGALLLLTGSVAVMRGRRGK
jgi:hypothetical protein